LPPALAGGPRPKQGVFSAGFSPLDFAFRHFAPAKPSANETAVNLIACAAEAHRQAG